MSSQLKLQRPKNVDEEAWAKLQHQISGIDSETEKATGIKPAGGLTPQQLKNANPEDLGNSESVELQWAMRAGIYAETYMRLLAAVEDRTKLKLTRHDDYIYDHFRRTFPKLDIRNLSEDSLKNKKSKQKWRPFLESYKQTLKDYSMGTLVRLHADEDFSPDNSILVPRAQFYAIEIARNREGHNDAIKWTEHGIA
eukprot:271687_1